MAVLRCFVVLSILILGLKDQYVFCEAAATINGQAKGHGISLKGNYKNELCSHVVISHVTESTMNFSWDKNACDDKISAIKIIPLQGYGEIDLCDGITCQNGHRTVHPAAGINGVKATELCPGIHYFIWVYFKDKSSKLMRTKTQPGKLAKVKDFRVASFGGEANSKTVELRWTNPSCTKDLDQIRCKVSYKEKSAVDFNYTQPSPQYEEHVLLSNLKPWTVYVFKVEFCVEPPKYLEPCSESDTIEAKTTIGIPMKPKDVRITAQTKSELIVQWTPAEPQTGPTNYMVQLDEAQPDLGTGCDLIGPLSWSERVKTATVEGWEQNRFIFDDLKLNHCYRAMVIGQTEAGSTFSDYSNIIIVK